MPENKLRRLIKEGKPTIGTHRTRYTKNGILGILHLLSRLIDSTITATECQ
jgi:hypothetical protein